MISLFSIFLNGTLYQMPDNEALEGLAGGLVKAWKIYNKPESAIMFLIEEVTYNICDQKFHEFEIRKQCPEVFVIRKTLTELGNRAEMKEVGLKTEQVLLFHLILHFAG